MRIGPFVCILLLLVGCGQKTGPILSHGKPVTYWIEALNSSDAKERKKAVEALGHVGPADSAVVPALAGAVKDRDAAVRAQAVLALLNIGPDAKEAIPVLIESQTDKDAKVREYAGNAIKRIEGDL
jgi:HEAT repeat protein